MFFYHFSFLVVFLDVIQLLSFSDGYGTKVEIIRGWIKSQEEILKPVRNNDSRVAEGELNDQENNSYMNSIKKWMPSVSNYMESLQNEKLGPNRLMMGKNDKLTPISSILSNDDSSKAESRRRRKRKLSTEFLELQKEIENAVGEQVAENYPEPSAVAVPDGVPEGLAEFAELEEFIDSANKVKQSS